MYNVNIKNLITNEIKVKKVDNIVDGFLNNSLEILSLNNIYEKLISITNEKGEKLNFTFDFKSNTWIEFLMNDEK